MLKSLLFRIDPETAHDLARHVLKTLQLSSTALKLVAAQYTTPTAALGQHIFGLHFPNPIGMAAGFDKNGEMIRALAALGFGFVEIGSVTPLPQTGNPKPRLFRHVGSQTLQNAMGFNNAGMEFVKHQLTRMRAQGSLTTPLGVNVGKNKATPTDRALEDYQQLLTNFDPLADYLVINISSPNTPGLRDLQNEAFVRDLFQMALSVTKKPVLLKIAPDMELSAAIALSQLAVSHGAAGIIASNTTTDYSLLPGVAPVGGLSGRVLCEKSFALLRGLARELFGKTVLISVGGIDSAEEVYRRLKAGASLVQLYSSLVFHGPGLPHHMNVGLHALLAQDGAKHIGEIIGCNRM